MSNETKHTRGPYSISGIPGDNHIMAQIGQARQTVCIVTGWRGIEPEELEANKHLFQAAPDLLAACERLVIASERIASLVTADDDESQAKIVAMFATTEKAKALIAKAKNQTEL